MIPKETHQNPLSSGLLVVFFAPSKSGLQAMDFPVVLAHLQHQFSGQMVLDVDDLAKVLGRSDRAISNLIARDALPFKVKTVGAKRCVDIFQVAQWLSSDEAMATESVKVDATPPQRPASASVDGRRHPRRSRPVRCIYQGRYARGCQHCTDSRHAMARGCWSACCGACVAGAALHAADTLCRRGLRRGQHWCLAVPGKSNRPAVQCSRHGARKGFQCGDGPKRHPGGHGAWQGAPRHTKQGSPGDRGAARCSTRCTHGASCSGPVHGTCSATCCRCPCARLVRCASVYRPGRFQAGQRLARSRRRRPSFEVRCRGNPWLRAAR